MTDSAIESPRERRIAETSRRLRAEARRLTAERGLSGFTVEEVCALAGVSRRTFFNYFASKENAVLGIHLRTDTSDLDDAFVASPSALLEALAELHIARWERMDMSPAEAPAIAAAFEREPGLVRHLLDLTAEDERADIVLVQRRQGWDAGDPRAAVAVQLLGALMRPTVTDYFEGPDEVFRTLFLRRLEAAHRLFLP
ncbi:TetR/AcrR family transcriptional regulator [Microbacterium sp. LRZ72]|uniref:TetR/AcrR family transcriptional regulator n=1 Tax=Microbacterium sp. LRZ72 TaxID=2942481 RepID=UPI0029ABCD75|nr:helix-turn-helix domain-containing protein [Microbacterium sp. LRZ72]MDX2376742.1 TetR/AcrR family transcriptional regulator [Microbacterium sp. LRZ72]